MPSTVILACTTLSRNRRTAWASTVTVNGHIGMPLCPEMYGPLRHPQSSKFLKFTPVRSAPTFFGDKVLGISVEIIFAAARGILARIRRCANFVWESFSFLRDRDCSCAFVFTITFSFSINHCSGRFYPSGILDKPCSQVS